MLEIKELKFGYNDAENYRRKAEKELFNSLFVRTECRPSAIMGHERGH